MGLIFWIDENTFATSLVEKALKSQGMDFYTVANARDFAYLIQDLKPAFVVVNSATALKNIEAFQRQYEETQGFFGSPVVILGDTEPFSFVTNPIRKLERPFDPFKLKDFFR